MKDLEIVKTLIVQTVPITQIRLNTLVKLVNTYQHQAVLETLKVVVVIMEFLHNAILLMPVLLGLVITTMVLAEIINAKVTVMGQEVVTMQKIVRTVILVMIAGRMGMVVR